MKKVDKNNKSDSGTQNDSAKEQDPKVAQVREFIRAFTDVYKLHEDEYVIEYEDGVPYRAKIVTDRAIDSSFELVYDHLALHAYVNLYPPLNQGSFLEKEDFIYQLTKAYGVKPEYLLDKEIDKVLALSRKKYVANKLLVARGVYPILPIEAKISWLVKPSKSSSDEFFSTYNISKDLVLVDGKVPICTVTPGVEGVAGVSVFGEEIPVDKPKIMDLQAGVGVLYEDNMFISNEIGHVVLLGNELRVDKVKRIRGSLNKLKGHIDYKGTIVVEEDVMPGMIINANNVFIYGVAQDAIINAENNIIVQLGIKGRGHGRLNAGGSIFFGYAENTSLNAGDTVYIEKYMFNCDVCANNSIKTLYDNSIIAGGKVRAFKTIDVHNLGTVNQTNFFLKVGFNPKIEDTLTSKRIEREKLKESVNKVIKLLSSVRNKDKELFETEKIKKLAEVGVLLKRKLQNLHKEIIEQEKILIYHSPAIQIFNSAFETIDLIFYNEKLRIKNRIEGYTLYKYDTRKNEIYVDIDEHTDSVGDV